MQIKPVRLIRLPEVIRRVALGRSAIYERIARSAFPRPRVLSPCAVAWVESEVEAWIEALPIR